MFPSGLSLDLDPGFTFPFHNNDLSDACERLTNKHRIRDFRRSNKRCDILYWHLIDLSSSLCANVVYSNLLSARKCGSKHHGTHFRNFYLELRGRSKDVRFHILFDF